MKSYSPVKSIEVSKGKKIADLINDFAKTGFQARTLAKVCTIFEKMIQDQETTIILGYSGSLSTTGQRKIIQWLLDNEFIDILVSTGANISEDIVESLGFNYFQGSFDDNDNELFNNGFNRYYDILGREEDYYKMTKLIKNYILILDRNYPYSSRELLCNFGVWLGNRHIDCIISSATKKNIPVFSPAIIDSPYGDAILLAKRENFDLIIDSAKDYVEFMNLAQKVEHTGVIYIGGGVPKDFIQLFAVSPSLLFDGSCIPGGRSGKRREITDEVSYPHKYAVQITTDSPQWGGLSGCTFEEATSWGKEIHNEDTVQCFCDATIALPLLSHYLSDILGDKKRIGKSLNKYFK